MQFQKPKFYTAIYWIFVYLFYLILEMKEIVNEATSDKIVATNPRISWGSWPDDCQPNTLSQRGDTPLLSSHTLSGCAMTFEQKSCTITDQTKLILSKLLHHSHVDIQAFYQIKKGSLPHRIEFFWCKGYDVWTLANLTCFPPFW